QRLLHRAPDTAGEQAWVTGLEQGASFEQVVAGFLGSGEYQNQFVAASGQLGATVTVTDLLGEPVTLSSPGHTLENVSVQAAPSGTSAAGAFPWGLFSFTVTGIDPG